MLERNRTVFGESPGIIHNPPTHMTKHNRINTIKQSQNWEIHDNNLLWPYTQTHTSNRTKFRETHLELSNKTVEKIHQVGMKHDTIPRNIIGINNNDLWTMVHQLFPYIHQKPDVIYEQRGNKNKDYPHKIFLSNTGMISHTIHTERYTWTITELRLDLINWNPKYFASSLLLLQKNGPRGNNHHVTLQELHIYYWDELSDPIWFYPYISIFK